MIHRWVVTEPRVSRKGCLLALPGRGLSAEMIDHFCRYMGLQRTLRICLEPEELEWYPAPNGVGDQDLAILGCNYAREVLEERVDSIQRGWGLKRSEIALAGYSAGAVMSLKLCMESQEPFAGCFAIAGAILDTKSVGKVKNKTPILLRHNIDDECFKWGERYVPMREALKRNGYNLFCQEDNVGGHGIFTEDAEIAGKFLAPLLGY